MRPRTLEPASCALLWLRGLTLAAVGAAMLTAAPFVFVTTSLPDAKYGNEYTARVEATGGVPPYSFHADPVTVPSGLQFGNGFFYAAPLCPPGTYPVRIWAFDSSAPSQRVEAIFTIRVLPGIRVQPLWFQTGTVGQAYSGQVTASGGTPPYRYAVTSGTFPPGLTLGAGNGLISGTPTVRGSYRFQLTVTDSLELTGSCDSALDINGTEFTLSPAILSGGRVGVPYPSVTLVAGGGTPPYRFTLQSYVLPPGMSLSQQGVISGTPTTQGGYGFEIKVTDQPGNWWTFTRSIVVQAPLDITPAALPPGVVNSTYEVSVQAVGFLNDVVMWIESGALPPGLQFIRLGTATYEVNGRPTKPGTYTFTVRATDSATSTLSRTYTIQIPDPLQEPLALPPSLPVGWIGELYSTGVYPVNGRPPVTVALTSGSLPPGLSLVSPGVVSGTPTAAGAFLFRVEARDADNRTGSRDYTVKVFANHLTVLPATIPDAQAGADYSVTFTATGGVPPYTFAPGIPGTPELVPLSPSGVLSGRPPRATTYTFEVHATDSQGNTGMREYVFRATGVVITTETLPDALWGQPYSARLTASNGQPPYRFQTGCTLPAGLALSPDGLISGIPTGGGGASCVIWVYDSAGASNYRRFVITYRQAALTLGPTRLPDARVNINYSQDISAMGASGPVTFSITNGSLPPGLTTSTSVLGYLTISGIPRSAGSYPFRLTATDGTATVWLDYNLVVANQPILLRPDTLPNGVLWAPYTADMTASGGVPPYRFSILTGYFPTGVLLSADGAIRGRPEYSGSFGVIIQATDSQGSYGTNTYQFVVPEATLVLSPFDLPTGALRLPYSVSLGASGGKPPYTYSVVTGSLPRGLALSPSGSLSGTPEQSGDFQIRIVVRDSSGAVGSRSYQLWITGDTFTLGPASLPDGRYGQPYSARLTATGGVAPYTFELRSGMWSEGLRINPDGSITGTPIGTGSATLAFVVFVTDANGSYASREYQIRLSSGPLALSPPAMPSGVVGKWYDVILSVSNGTGPYGFRLASGSLPPGLELYAQGRIFGTPSRQGDYSFRLEVTDATGSEAGRDYMVHVSASGITLSPGVLPDGKVGVTYSSAFTAGGGTAPYTFILDSGSLPRGLTLAPSGVLAGTPTAEGAFSFRVQATDFTGSVGTLDCQMVVRPAGVYIGPDTLPAARLGRSYSVAFGASDGTPPYRFSLSSGSLAPGLTLSAAGLLEGVPQQAGAFVFEVHVTDSRGVDGARDYTIQVDSAGVVVTPAVLSPALAGQFYSAKFTATGGTGPYSFSLHPNSPLPLGMSLSSGGTLRGTPANPGTYRFTLSVTDARSSTTMLDMRLEVLRSSFRIAPDILPVPTLRVPYSVILTAEGGAVPYVFALSSGALPPGLYLAPSGLLSGIAQAGGVFAFRIQATDSQGAKAWRDYELRVSAIEILPSALGRATAGRGFLTVFSAVGGTPPYLFSLSSGQFPPGLALAGGSSVSGTPTTPGAFHFTVQATDSNGATGARQYSFVVDPAGIIVTPESLPEASRGEDYSALFTARGGTPPYSFSVKTGIPPPGLRLRADGVFSGTPTAAGAFRFTVEARDDTGAFETREYAVTVAGYAPLLVLTTWLPKASTQSRYTIPLEASGGEPDYIWSICAGALPTGLRLAADGTLSGTPAESGQFLFTVLVTDSAGRTAEQVLPLAVVPPPEGGNTLFLDPAELSFHVRENSSGPGETRCIAVFSTKDSVEVRPSLYTLPTAWATLGSSTLRTPASLCLTVQSTGLAPGTYRGELRLTSAQTAPASIAIPLVFAVEPEIPPRLRVAPRQVQVPTVLQAPASSRTVLVFNDGSGSLPYTVDGSPSAWLTVLPTSGTAMQGSPSALMLRVDPGGLDPGVYSTIVTVRSTDSVENVRVELVVTDGRGLLSLSQTALEMVAWTSDGAASDTVGVTNDGLIPLSPLVEATVPAGTEWLRAKLAAPVLQPGGAASLEITADPRQLSPGRYTGLVEVRAAGAVNTPQAIRVGLTVLPSGSPLPPEASLSALVLTPSLQQASLALPVPPARPLGFTSVVLGPDADWLRITPAEGTVAAGASLDVTISAALSGLAPGQYHATVAVGFSDGTVRSIPVSVLVPSPATPTKRYSANPADGCSAGAALALHVLSPVPGFLASTGRPVAVRVRLQHCEGAAVSAAEVIARAGGAAFALASESPGIWAGTWIPVEAGGLSLLELTAAAGEAASRDTASAAVEGRVTAGTFDEPQVVSALHSASLRANDPVVPVGWITVYGSNLAREPVTVHSSTLPESLGGLRVLLGGLPLRLYYAGAGQLNAIVPRALSPNTRQQLLLFREGTSAVPLTVSVAEAQPGVFTANQRGTGQAAALVAGTLNLAAPASPGRRGDFVELYCTGLGPVDNAPDDGELAAQTQLARAKNTPTVTVGGHPAEVAFAGLTPGTFGLYQINFRIPDDAPTGDAVEVLVIQKEAVSNLTTIAVSAGR